MQHLKILVMQIRLREFFAVDQDDKCLSWICGKSDHHSKDMKPSVMNLFHRFGMTTLITVLMFCFSGCATIISGRKHEVTIDNRGGATYFSILDSKNQVVHSGVTPQQVTLKSSTGPFRPAKYHVVYASQEGAFHQDLGTRTNWWIAGNILVGGVPGIAIDAASGAMWKLQPSVTGQVPANLIVTNPAQGAEMLASGSMHEPQNENSNSRSNRIQPASYGATNEMNE